MTRLNLPSKDGNGRPIGPHGWRQVFLDANQHVFLEEVVWPFESDASNGALLGEKRCNIQWVPLTQFGSPARGSHTNRGARTPQSKFFELSARVGLFNANGSNSVYRTKTIIASVTGR